MKISIFGHDVAAKENLEMVAKVAEQNGHNVQTAFGNPPSLADWEPDVFLTGMASTEPEGDLRMGEMAEERQKPWVVLADTWFSGFRQAARRRTKNNAILLTASKEELQAALNFGYRDARFLGGPPKWQTIATELQVDVRKKYGVPDGQRIFLVSGGKNHLVVTEMLEAFEKAVRELLRDDFRVIFKPHRKESEDRDDARRTAVIAKLQTNLINAAERQTALMDSSDCIISSPGGSATTEAIYRRRPNIWWENPKALERFVKMTDNETWPPLDAKATLRTGTPVTERLLDIRNAIATVLSPEGHELMRRKQEESFPIVAPQEIESRIINFLESLVQDGRAESIKTC